MQRRPPFLTLEVAVVDLYSDGQEFAHYPTLVLHTAGERFPLARTESSIEEGIGSDEKAAFDSRVRRIAEELRLLLVRELFEDGLVDW